MHSRASAGLKTHLFAQEFDFHLQAPYLLVKRLLPTFVFLRGRRAAPAVFTLHKLLLPLAHLRRVNLVLRGDLVDRLRLAQRGKRNTGFLGSAKHTTTLLAHDIPFLAGLGPQYAILCNCPENRVHLSIAIGRKNFLFLGSDRGGRAAATLYSLVRSAKRHELDPFIYLRDLFLRIPTHPNRDIHLLLPDHWKRDILPTLDSPPRP